MVGHALGIHMSASHFAIVLLWFYFLTDEALHNGQDWTNQSIERCQERGGIHGYRIQFDRLMVKEHPLALLPTTLSRAQKTDFSFKVAVSYISFWTQGNCVYETFCFK